MDRLVRARVLLEEAAALRVTLDDLVAVSAMVEVVSEATSVVLEFPFARRTTIPGQLLLDTRKRFSREASVCGATTNLASPVALAAC